LVVLAVGTWFTGAVPGFAQTGPDNLWEVTSSMAMEGMRMPGMTVQVCAKAGQSDGLMPPMQGDCQLADRQTVGNRTTFRVTCTGKDAMSGTGEMTTGPSSYQGIMRLSGKMDGETANITTEYAGKLLGKCTAR
jgi:hypothetical protein